MTGADLIQQINPLNIGASVLVSTPNGVFVVSSAQQDENGAVLLRAMETAATVDGKAEYHKMRGDTTDTEGTTVTETNPPAR